MHAGGARVIQIGGGTRDLYYYPKDTVLVTAISPKLKKGMTPVFWAYIERVAVASACMPQLLGAACMQMLYNIAAGVLWHLYGWVSKVFCHSTALVDCSHALADLDQMHAA